MSIRRRTPPQAAVQALQLGLRRIGEATSTPTLAAARARLAVRSVISMRGAVRIYQAGVEDLLTEKSLTKLAKPVGWRFFVPGLSNDQAAEVVGGPKGYRMTRWIQGPDNRRFLDTVERLVLRPEVRNAKFELRCLEIPGLHLLAVWLYWSGHEQLLVPVSYLPVAIETGKLLPLSEFDPLVREHARSLVQRAAVETPTSMARTATTDRPA